MEYLIVIEKAGKNYSAYIPDVPGCVATGKTPEKAKKQIKEALKFHLEGLKEAILPTPVAAALGEYIAV